MRKDWQLTALCQCEYSSALQCKMWGGVEVQTNLDLLPKWKGEVDFQKVDFPKTQRWILQMQLLHFISPAVSRSNYEKVCSFYISLCWSKIINTLPNQGLCLKEQHVISGPLATLDMFSNRFLTVFYCLDETDQKLRHWLSQLSCFIISILWYFGNVKILFRVVFVY